MAVDPSVFELNQLLASYTNPQITPFKLKMAVLQNESERKFFETYTKECIPQQFQQPATSTTGNVFGSSLGGSSLGSSLTGSFGGSFGSSLGGTSTNQSSFGSFGTNLNQTQNQNTNQQIKPVPGHPDKMEMEICFFKGLEMRAKYQDDRQVELLEELSKLQKDVQDVMSSIQEEILEKYDSIAERASKLDEQIISILTREETPDETIMGKFKELLMKIDSSDTEKKVQLLLSVLNSKEFTKSNNGESLDAASIKEISKALSEEQEIILSLGNQVTELKAKYEQLKSRYGKMNSK